MSRYLFVVPPMVGHVNPSIAVGRELLARGHDVAWAGPVRSRGEGPLARMVSLAAVADVVTLELAERYGVDPESVALIEDLKQSLKESG